MLTENKLQENEGQPTAPKSPSADELFDRLRQVYERQNKSDDFNSEAEVYKTLLPKLIARLEGAGYVLNQPLAIGSTASVWVVYDRELRQRRALKLPRPRLGKLKNIVLVVRAERERLAALNHQNIIKIYSSGEVDLDINGEGYSFPYFVMEYLEDIQDLDDYIISNLRSITGEEVINYFRDLLSGLSFLHEQSVIHCDIKPGNLLKAPNSPALIADLGYAKHFNKLSLEERKLTQVIHTPHYAHPELGSRLVESSDSNANVAEIPRNRLRPAFDLFAFGRSMQEVLIKIKEAEKVDPAKGYGRESIFSHYQWGYLSYIAKRLLDGKVIDSSDDAIKSDVIPGLPDNVMEQLCYRSAEEALEDFEKLLHLYDLEGEIPELNPNLSSYIQIPHCRVPLTRRVQEIINHSTFARLAQVTQLGFVSLIYPSATHTRFEHVLGTFTHCCEYIRALWYDQANGLFQSIMSKKDIELCLLAALLHDIGQYPMAHDLTEVASDFAHEQLTAQALLRIDPISGESLSQVISSEWGIDTDDILSVIHANRESDFRHRILHSLISGPLDCDKLDYLKRDSTHLGVSFGLSIDHERLLRNLTVAYRSTERVVTLEGRELRVRELESAEVGVTEKALVVAQSLWKVRRDMFSQIYWHHTTRALKSMLGYVVRKILIALDTEERKDQFWRDFHKFVFTPLTFANQSAEVNQENHEIESSDDVWAVGADDNADISLVSSSLYPTDDALLMFLWEYASDEEKRMIQAIRSRKVYRRAAVLSGTRKHREFQQERIMYDNIYGRFQTYRMDGNLERIEQDRQTWEEQIINQVESLLAGDDSSRLLQPGRTREDVITSLRSVKPLILVDIPIKATSIKAGNEYLLYLPEDYAGVHSRLPGAFPQFTPSITEIEQTSFDKEVGKIRILAHPEWTEFLVRCVPEHTILEIVSGVKTH